MKWMTLAAAAVVALGAVAPAARADETSRLRNAAQVVSDINGSIPPDLWNRAECVVVIPDVKKAAFMFGGEYGRGAMSCRTDAGWSAPVFMQLAKGSWGFQLGAQEVDLVMLVMNRQGMEKLLQDKVELGAGASIAAGPVGRNASAGTDAQLSAELLSYSKARGLFAGIDLSGGVLRPDEDSNREEYGPDASPRRILARQSSAGPDAAPFLSALRMASSEMRSPMEYDRATGSTMRPTDRRGTDIDADDTARTGSAGDAELRDRVARVQEMIDRLLADGGASSAVGTSGRSDDVVTVDRARLLDLRQQIDALMLAIDRRR